MEEYIENREGPMDPTIPSLPSVPAYLHHLVGHGVCPVSRLSVLVVKMI